MRILEARESFIKFESEENIQLSSFIQIANLDKVYVAQIIKVQKVNDKFLVFAKLLYLYNGSLESYDGTLPEKDAEISVFDYNKFSQSISVETPVLVGKFIAKRENIFIDKTSFNKKTIVSAESPEFLDVFTTNLKQELSKTSRTFIIDMQGVIPAQKFAAGKDFRLPLNAESLNFMYEDCLSDSTQDSKSLIKEIFQDLSEYSKTVPFVPFGALKTIVDDMVDNSHVFKLLVLKNKLKKFDEMGYFAANQDEASNLNKILTMQSAVLDLSKLDALFQNRYLEIILKSLNENSNVIVIASNNINKKNLKTILTAENIASTFVTHPRFKYINEIKSMFKNFIIEPSFVNNEVFKAYVTFLSAMKKGSYLIVGENTNYLPLISILEKLPEEVVIDSIDESILDELAEDFEEVDIEENDEIISAEVAPVVIEDKDEQTEAIDKKSEALVEKITEDLEQAPQSGLSLFEEDNEVEENEETDVDLQEDDLDDENISDIAEEISEDDSQEEFHTRVDEIKAIDVSEDIIEITEEIESEDMVIEDAEIEEASEVVITTDSQEIVEEVELDNTIQDYEDIVEIPDDIEDDIQVIEDEETNNAVIEPEEVVSSEFDVEPIDEEVIEVDGIEEITSSDIEEADVIVELDDFEDFEDEDSLEKEIIEDVDKVFTTMREDSLSDNDLDLIDELNNENNQSDFEELTELQESEKEELDFIEPIEELNDNSDFVEEREILETKKSSTPNVPVYDAEIPAEDTVMSDLIEQGDTVTHAKYGVGVVEKMIKYGNKTLFSINFDNVGRRLLDPTLTEIKKS